MLNARLWKSGIAYGRSAINVQRRWLPSMPKKKFALNLKYKEGRQLALEHFDFYYKPIFRQRWPSIRLGLTSRSKTGAMINNFGHNISAMIEDIEASGAVDLIPLLDECKARRLEETGHSGHQLNEAGLTPEMDPAVNHTMNDQDNPESTMQDSRSAETIHEFVQPTKLITRETVPEYLDDRPEVLDTWKPEDVQFIRDEVVYPKHLRMFVYPLGDITRFEEPIYDDNVPLRTHQILDPAILFPILALDIRPDEDVLDLCASPGEKTLALLQTLIPCNVVCNDVNAGRINLLRHNLRLFIPQNDDVRQRIRFMRVDAVHFQKEHTQEYDKVLVDVPNTEDRKSLRASDREGNLFRRSETSERLQLPDQQMQILIGGLKALRRGGCLVYTTSTLSPNQNDEVVETALRRLHQDPEVDSEFAVCDLESLATDFYEAKILRFARGQCKYGQLVIPFLPNNYGPVYTCKLKRLQ